MTIAADLAVAFPVPTGATTPAVQAPFLALQQSRFCFTIAIPLLSGLTNAQTLQKSIGMAIASSPFPSASSFQITSAEFVVGPVPASTASKLATLTVCNNGIAVTGGVLSLTTASCNAAGLRNAATAITQNSAGLVTSAAPLLGVLVSGVTAFVEGGGEVNIYGFFA